MDALILLGAAMDQLKFPAHVPPSVPHGTQLDRQVTARGAVSLCEPDVSRSDRRGARQSIEIGWATSPHNIMICS
jgi:hypothetical protein